VEDCLKKWLRMQKEIRLSASIYYLMATESTEEHEKMNTLQNSFRVLPWIPWQ